MWLEAKLSIQAREVFTRFICCVSLCALSDDVILVCLVFLYLYILPFSFLVFESRCRLLLVPLKIAKMSKLLQINLWRKFQIEFNEQR